MRLAKLSIVIPTLDAAAELPATLSALAEGRRCGLIAEIIVVDGHSVDATAGLAESLGARVVVGGPGRGQQLAAGAEAASGDWLLFLHADTRLAPGWAAVAAAFTASQGDEERAAAFTLRLDAEDPPARRVERLAAWRARRLGLPYGDQGLLIARSLYQRIGGFRPLPLMEDVELARRLGRGRLVILPTAAVTSARRYRRGGWWLRPARNLFVLGLYYLGVPTRILRRIYG